jgi:hypothetical protein
MYNGIACIDLEGPDSVRGVRIHSRKLEPFKYRPGHGSIAHKLLLRSPKNDFRNGHLALVRLPFGLLEHSHNAEYMVRDEPHYSSK